MKKYIAAIIFIALFLSMLAPQARAQTIPDLDLLMFPASTYLQVIPGKSITHRVLFQYTGSQPIQVTPRVRDFTADGTTGIPVVQETVSFSSISLRNPNMKLGQPFVMQPNTKFDLVLEITPDSGVIEKEYHLILLATAEPMPGSLGSNSGAAASGVIGSNMIISVSPDGTNKGEIKMSKFPMSRFVDSFGEITIKALAENTGDTATVPKGSITMHHWQGKELGNWFIYPDVILAKSTRLLRATPIDPSTVTEETKPDIVEMKYDAPFLLGPYTITTQLVDAKNTATQHTTVVYAFPFSIIAVILLGLASYLTYRFFSAKLTQKQW
jgi:hypothetical protein